MNASWPNDSSTEVKEYTAEEDAQMLREADELQKKRWAKESKAPQPAKKPAQPAPAGLDQL
jgi:hypothetical protein